MFQEKKKYVYAVFERIVQTDAGKDIVRQHENDYDAQKVYEELEAHHFSSTKAKMSQSDTLKHLTTLKAGDGWNGTAESLVLHIIEQFRVYKKLVEDPQDYLTDRLK